MNCREQLKKWIEESDNIVFFGGAGVSTESGVPDFRSQDGLYKMKYKYPPEVIISHTFFMNKPKDFYDFYRDKMLYPQAKPNRAHLALARLEEQGKLKAVITQNIDGLHQMAGSRQVLELHGSVMRNYCMKCGKFHDMKEIYESDDVPYCECGGMIKPDVVLYEEMLNDEVMSKAADYIRKADLFIVGGTSLVVYPAAGFINYYNGTKMVLINMSPTKMDEQADLLIPEKIGEVLGDIVGV